MANLRGAPQLQPFLLSNVRPTGRRIGGGAYGTVEELEMEGLLCAGKKLHEVFFERAYQDVHKILEKFVEECSLLAYLRHPHVVQFLGICFLDGSDLPVLVMEYLPYCLDSLLEGPSRVDMPLAMKLSILHDVAQGLSHLHARSPPVIHRDLTAKNILLTSAMTGKIADLGVARILNVRPCQQARTMTQTPGTLAYMPPEALDKTAKYNSTIDIFSFGHLALYTVVQEFPYPTAPTRPDPNNQGVIVGLKEVQRRSEQMEQLSRQLGGERRPLVQLVTQCLHNDPGQRPSARQVLSQLEEVKARVEDPYEHMSKLELIQALRRSEGEKEALKHELTQYKEHQQADTQQYQCGLQQQVEPPPLFVWRPAKDLLAPISSAQAVVWNGKVYVGGGNSNTRLFKYSLQVYTPELDTWGSLRCPVCFFGMAVLEQALVLVGGADSSGACQSTLTVLDSKMDWTNPYPRMPTARYSPTAVAYMHFLVVVAGKAFRGRLVWLNEVNVLNTSTKHWSTVAPLPIGADSLTPAVIGDTLYLLGGFGERQVANTRMFSVTLSALVASVVFPTLEQHSSALWTSEDLRSFASAMSLLRSSSAVSIRNSLLALGGQEGGRQLASDVQLYNPLTRQWRKVGEVPAVLMKCACVVLPSGELMVVGGYSDSSTRSNKVYIATVR